MSSRFLIPLIIILLACNSDYTPKPRGFSKIDFPKKETKPSDTQNHVFSFKQPIYSHFIVDNKNPSWFDLEFKEFNGTIHMSYKTIENNLNEFTEDCRDLAYKHAQKAEAITEQRFINDSLNVYGVVYTFQGATASPLQFYLSDSSTHFVRGALYFNTAFNDSIIPICNFVKEDVYQIIESWQWKQL